MLMLQPVQQALPGVSPVRAPVAVETVTAVRGAAQGDRARNDGTRDRGAEAERLAREAKDHAADPAAPVGPPPAFRANLLEAERARLRKAEPLEATAERPGPDSETAKAGARSDVAEARGEARAEDAQGRDERAEKKGAPTSTRSAYGGVREDPPRMLDVSR